MQTIERDIQPDSETVLIFSWSLIERINASIRRLSAFDAGGIDEQHVWATIEPGTFIPTTIPPRYCEHLRSWWTGTLDTVTRTNGETRAMYLVVESAEPAKIS